MDVTYSSNGILTNGAIYNFTNRSSTVTWTKIGVWAPVDPWGFIVTSCDRRILIRFPA